MSKDPVEIGADINRTPEEESSCFNMENAPEEEKRRVSELKDARNGSFLKNR